MGRVQDFRDSVQNTWELQGSHFRDLDFPHADEKRDPTLKWRAAKAISISQWALDPESLMGNVCWFPGVTWSSYQRLQIEDTNMFIEQMPSQGLLSPYAGCWRNMKHVSCHEKVHFTSISQFHSIHKPTIDLSSHWFLAINITSMIYVNPLESTLFLMSYTTIVTW